MAEDIGPVTFSVLTGLIGPVVGAMKGDLPALRALAQAHAGNSRAALIQAARSRLLVLGREPLTYSPVVAATASRLRRLFPAGRHPAMGLLSP